MRTTNFSEKKSNINEKTLYKEYRYYLKHNTTGLSFDNCSVLNLYNKINIQVVTTYMCNKNCWFCIEKGKRCIKNDEKIKESLDKLLRFYNKKNIFPYVTFTGGEPTIFMFLLDELIKITKLHRTSGTNINTNGFNIDLLKEKTDIINLSRSAYEEIPEGKHIIQSVITSDMDIENINFFLDKLYKVDGFSFRTLTITENMPKKKIKQIYKLYNKLSAFFSKLVKEKKAEFVQQKIGDHFVYEHYLINNKIVRLVFSDFNLLSKLQKIEQNKNIIVSRANVIKPDGTIYSGWITDKEIKL